VLILSTKMNWLLYKDGDFVASDKVLFRRVWPGKP